MCCAPAVNPGFGGQGFIQSQVKKIKKLREMCNEYGVNPWIEIDGGVTPNNAAEVGLVVLARQYTPSFAIWQADRDRCTQSGWGCSPSANSAIPRRMIGAVKAT